MSQRRKILQGSASNIIRVCLSALAALVLPPIFARRMTPVENGAWLLVLQCSAYVALLDFGLQTAIGKFIAEHETLNARIESNKVISNAIVLLCISSAIGGATIAFIGWHITELFHQMPVGLEHTVRICIWVVGFSAVFSLPFNAFLAVFIGLQKYGFPTALTATSKVCTSATLAMVILLHGGLIHLALTLAFFTLMTALVQLFGWRCYAREYAQVSIRFINRGSIWLLAKFGSVLSIWTLAGLLISGTDLFIVGHYDYGNTAYYGIASTVTNFMLLLITNIFSPLLPAISSLQTARTPEEIGDIVVKMTRYSVLLICCLSFPLLIGAYPLLKLWVGPDYAIHSTAFLQILVLGNAFRMILYPYSLAVIATGTQHLATISSIAEAGMNFILSIILVQHIGTIGVAIGTLIGAFIGAAVHFLVSMKLTHTIVLMSRRKFITEGVGRPLICAIPSAILLIVCRNPKSSLGITVWIISLLIPTYLIIWFLGLSSKERIGIKRIAGRLVFAKGRSDL